MHDKAFAAILETIFQARFDPGQPKPCLRSGICPGQIFKKTLLLIITCSYIVLLTLPINQRKE